AHGKGDEYLAGHGPDHGDVDGTPFRRGHDVVKHQFIHPVAVIGAAHFHRIAQIDVALELDALGDLSIADVQAYDDAPGQHDPDLAVPSDEAPSHSQKFFSSARPHFPLFSAWNWQAARLPRPSTEAKATPPYSVSASTSPESAGMG